MGFIALVPVLCQGKCPLSKKATTCQQAPSCYTRGMPAKSSKILTLTEPKGLRVPLVVDSPHSGTLLPEDFHFICPIGDLRQSEEPYVDHFGAKVPENGGIFLKALVSRSYIDLNRAISDLHPSMCRDEIPWPLHRSKRVTYGIGLIRYLVWPQQPVYAEPLSLGEIQHRIKHYYDPYYDALGSAMKTMHEEFGRVLHVNLHAMPLLGADGSPQPDIVLGDHDGHSCARAYREIIKKTFEKHGLKVVVNNPYKGVELTRRFARPRQGFHSVQIEVNKALFMNEETMASTKGLREMQKVFDDLWNVLGEWLAESSAFAKAAE